MINSVIDVCWWQYLLYIFKCEKEKTKKKERKNKQAKKQYQKIIHHITVCIYLFYFFSSFFQIMAWRKCTIVVTNCWMMYQSLYWWSQTSKCWLMCVVLVWILVCRSLYVATKSYKWREEHHTLLKNIDLFTVEGNTLVLTVMEKVFIIT